MMTPLALVDPHFPFSFTLVYIVGFIAAATLGSIAWYNSKRPPGWEDQTDQPPSEADSSNPPQ